jgi:hypothetical protein
MFCKRRFPLSEAEAMLLAVFGNEGRKRASLRCPQHRGGLSFFVFQSAANSVARCWHDNAVWYGEDETLFPYQSIAFIAAHSIFSPVQIHISFWMPPIGERLGMDAAGKITTGVFFRKHGRTFCAVRLDADVRSYKTTGRIRFSDGSYEFFKKLTYTPEGHLVDLESIVNSESLPPYTWTYTNSRGEVFARTDNFPQCGL